MRDRFPTNSSAPIDLPPFGTRSPVMRKLWAETRRLADANCTVLITGESGVGKERVARWLHQASPRRARTFVAVNCGELADTLLETELFGHARGAFTGANHERAGLIEAAHQSTLFLDEIGEISAAMQAKLLRVLQEREVRRVGETITRRVDFRLIAATNRDLTQEVAEQRFRRDLFYRLNVVELRVPPLRDRPGDIRQLAREFLIRAAAHLERPAREYTTRALACLVEYDWPGNVRELEHAVERACAIATDTRIDLEDLPESVRHGGGFGRRGRRLRPFEALRRDYTLSVLRAHHGNRRDAARALCISLSTLKRILRTCRISNKTRRSGSFRVPLVQE